MTDTSNRLLQKTPHVSAERTSPSDEFHDLSTSAQGFSLLRSSYLGAVGLLTLLAGAARAEEQPKPVTEKPTGGNVEKAVTINRTTPEFRSGFEAGLAVGKTLPLLDAIESDLRRFDTAIGSHGDSEMKAEWSKQHEKIKSDLSKIQKSLETAPISIDPVQLSDSVSGIMDSVKTWGLLVRAIEKPPSTLTAPGTLVPEKVTILTGDVISMELWDRYGRTLFTNIFDRSLEKVIGDPSKAGPQAPQPTPRSALQSLFKPGAAGVPKSRNERLRPQAQDPQPTKPE